jgi:hypothetical protein
LRATHPHLAIECSDELGFQRIDAVHGEEAFVGDAEHGGVRCLVERDRRAALRQRATRQARGEKRTDGDAQDAATTRLVLRQLN